MSFSITELLKIETWARHGLTEVACSGSMLAWGLRWTVWCGGLPPRWGPVMLRKVAHVGHPWGLTCDPVRYASNSGRQPHQCLRSDGKLTDDPRRFVLKFLQN
jgi:hypothetical protein